MSRAVHVQATWGRRCNVLLFVTEKDDVGALSVMKVDVATGREHLTAKTMSAFDHIYEHHRDEADWFLKVSCHDCSNYMEARVYAGPLTYFQYPIGPMLYTWVQRAPTLIFL